MLHRVRRLSQFATKARNRIAGLKMIEDQIDKFVRNLFIDTIH